MTSAPAVVGVIGGGRMGAGIAQSFATAGSSVTIVESDERSAAQALERVATGLTRAAERDRFSEPVPRVLNRVTTVASVTDLPAQADLVVEAVPEDAGLKASVLAAAEKSVEACTVLASNTSSLSVTELASALTEPARFLGMHDPGG
jgi:3-hydroxybutyryl-CoA dehydrogenase